MLKGLREGLTIPNNHFKDAKLSYVLVCLSLSDYGGVDGQNNSFALGFDRFLDLAFAYTSIRPYVELEPQSSSALALSFQLIPLVCDFC